MGKKYEINIKTFFDNGVSKLISGLDKGIKRAKKFGNAMRAGMHSAPVRLLRNALAGLVGTLAAGVMQAAKFNIELARAHTMTNQGIGWFKKMRNEIREMSAELGVAKDQLSGGLYQALSAGVPENNVLTFLHTAAKIAVADGSDVSTAVDGMSTVLNAFKIEAAETERVADQLFNTVANGKTTFAELAHHLATVAPIAAANGIALNEVLAAVATLTKQGTPTAQAMTQIRSAIIGANKALGDGWAKSMSLQDAFKKIEEAAGGSQTELQKMLGTIEGVQGVLGLTGINAAMAADDLAGAADAAGRVDAAFQKVDRWRHWQKLWQSISGLVERTAQEADSRLAPAVQRIIEGIAGIQDNDDLWAGLGDTLDEAQQNIAGIFEYIKNEGSDGAREVVDALGQILIGHAKNGSQEAIALLVKWAPVIGSNLGKAARDAFDLVDQDMPDFSKRKELNKQAREEMGINPFKSEPRYRELVEAETKKNREERLAREGNSASSNVRNGGGDGNGWGDDNIRAGYETLQKASSSGQSAAFLEGEIKRIEAEVNREIEVRRAEKSAENAVDFGQRWAALQQAKPMYREQLKQEDAAARAGAPNRTGPTADAARETLSRERAETAEVAKLISAVQTGNTNLTSQMLAALQRVIANQAKQQQQIEQNAVRIKNGRS